MRAATIGVCVGLCSLTACGGGSPAAPGGGGGSTTIQSITMTLRDLVLVGTTAAATATATLGNGQTQAVTAGFRSDAPTIATVTDGGTVTGVANGEATIIVASGGREATRRIRVAPNYDGRWQGAQRMTACSATGDFVGICEQDGGIIGDLYAISLTARQADTLTVSGEFAIEPLVFPTFTTQVEGDGTIRFTSTTTVEGIRAEVSWQMNAAQNGRAEGTIREKYTIPGVVTGEVTYDSALSSFVRGGTAAMPPAPGARAGVNHLRSRLRGFVRRQG